MRTKTHTGRSVPGALLWANSMSHEENGHYL